MLTIALLSKRDAAVSRVKPNFSVGCRLITFIKMLYIDAYADMVLNAKPDNMEETQSKDAFKDAVVCFTHFGIITDATAWAAFIRHMAILYRDDQHNVDCIISVLLWNAKLCEHVMSGVLIQFKRRTKSDNIAEQAIDQATLNFFPEQLEKCQHGLISCPMFYRPYISLIMEPGEGKVPDDDDAAQSTIRDAEEQKESAVVPFTKLHYRLREVQNTSWMTSLVVVALNTHPL
jgi:hypothetical protein